MYLVCLSDMENVSARADAPMRLLRFPFTVFLFQLREISVAAQSPGRPVWTERTEWSRRQSKFLSNARSPSDESSCQPEATTAGTYRWGHPCMLTPAVCTQLKSNQISFHMRLSFIFSVLTWSPICNWIVKEGLGDVLCASTRLTKLQLLQVKFTFISVKFNQLVSSSHSQ